MKKYHNSQERGGIPEVCKRDTGYCALFFLQVLCGKIREMDLPGGCDIEDTGLDIT